MKIVSNVPEWFNLVAKDGYLCGRDVANLFGFKRIDQASTAAYHGQFPSPDRVTGTKVKKFLWKKSTVLKEMQRRNAA